MKATVEYYCHNAKNIVCTGALALSRDQDIKSTGIAKLFLLLLYTSYTSAWAKIILTPLLGKICRYFVMIIRLNSTKIIIMYLC